jgi:hypothetical protein
MPEKDGQKHRDPSGQDCSEQPMKLTVHAPSLGIDAAVNTRAEAIDLAINLGINLAINALNALAQPGKAGIHVGSQMDKS